MKNKFEIILDCCSHIPKTGLAIKGQKSYGLQYRCIGYKSRTAFARKLKIFSKCAYVSCSILFSKNILLYVKQPCHYQAVKRYVKLVTEASSVGTGYDRP